MGAFCYRAFGYYRCAHCAWAWYRGAFFGDCCSCATCAMRTIGGVESLFLFVFHLFFSFSFSLAVFRHAQTDAMETEDASAAASKASTSVLRVAVFGTGRMGRIHAASVAAAPGMKLVYVVANTLAHAQEVATLHGTDVQVLWRRMPAAVNYECCRRPQRMVQR